MSGHGKVVLNDLRWERKDCSMREEGDGWMKRNRPSKGKGNQSENHDEQTEMEKKREK